MDLTSNSSLLPFLLVAFRAFDYIASDDRSRFVIEINEFDHAKG
jgi:hypothetical protein